jgi:hypothetical protein
VVSFRANRLVFFTVSDQKEASGFQVLLKSDRDALSSLSSVLRLRRDDDGDSTALRRSIVDFKDKATYLSMKNRENL